MPEWRTVEKPPNLIVYCYDGTFDGLLCCVFESYEKHELPTDVLPENMPLPLLLPVKTIDTNIEHAKRVRKSIPERMGFQALHFIRRAFLTCHQKKHLYILQFLRLGYRCGASVMNRLTDEPVHALFTAVRHLDNEAHLLKGFIRFSEINNALIGQIEPKNIILPLIARHFCERYPEETLLIYDKTNAMVLIYQNRTMSIKSVDAYEQPTPGQEEKVFRELWTLFYQTIEIKERHNPRCRMNHMPKRYWRYMTEFAKQEHAVGVVLLNEPPVSV